MPRPAALRAGELSRHESSWGAGTIVCVDGTRRESATEDTWAVSGQAGVPDVSMRD